MGQKDELSKPQNKTRRPKRLYPPSVMVFRSFLFLSILVFAISWFIGTVVVSQANWHGPAPAAAKSSARAILRRLARGEGDTMQKIFPEGRLFSHSFFGFSLVNMALNETPNSEFTRTAIREIEKLLTAIDGMVDKDPFSACKDITPRGGIIIAGQANLLRAGYLLIGGQKKSIAERFHKESQIIYDAFMKISVGSLESYPQLVWPVDNICALDSLRLHDLICGTDYAEAPKRWTEWMANNLDPESGMMVTQTSAWGMIFDGPRGCTLSWSLAFMGGFAPDFTKTQYARYRKNWITGFCGITGVREWRPGKEWKMDCDTGLVVGGIGMAATAFGIAATKANGDFENFQKLVREAEILSLPAWNTDGEINYFFGKTLLADVLLLWSKTLRPWDVEAIKTTELKPCMNFGFWAAFSILMLLCLTILCLLPLSLRKTYTEYKKRSLKLNGLNKVFLAFQALFFVLWALCPGFTWIFAILGTAAAEIIENTFFPLKDKQ
jgi:hypothetical protein